MRASDHVIELLSRVDIDHGDAGADRDRVVDIGVVDVSGTRENVLEPSDTRSQNAFLLTDRLVLVVVGGVPELTRDAEAGRNLASLRMQARQVSFEGSARCGGERNFVGP